MPPARVELASSDYETDVLTVIRWWLVLANVKILVISSNILSRTQFARTHNRLDAKKSSP